MPTGFEGVLRLDELRLRADGQYLDRGRSVFECRSIEGKDWYHELG